MPFLTGEEKSGTPPETRRASERAGVTFADLFTARPGPGATEGPGGRRARLRTASLEEVLQRIFSAAGGGAEETLGFNPEILQLGAALQQITEDPTSQTASLFESMRPFEHRTTEQAVGGLREAFGRGGGRFSRNLLEGETELRGELADRFARTRNEALLSARDRQIQGAGTAGQLLLGAGQQGLTRELGLLSEILRFIQPGESVQTEGLLPGLLSAGSTLGAAALL